MKGLLPLASLIMVTLCGIGAASQPPAYLNSTTAADCVVTFNQVMYHPPGADRSLEWIELHNQMSVDEDLSDWTLTGGVEFRFPRGTVIPAGAYLVIAADPTALRAATGLPTVLGPFMGALANQGERLVLRNLNQRLMDELAYNDNPPWPVGPDGSGASLAKRFAGSPSSPAQNWRASEQVNGTPGQANFPDPTTSTGPVFDSWIGRTAPARWLVPSAADAPLAWIQPSFDDSAWLHGTNGFGFDRSHAPPMTPASRFYPLESSAIDASGSGQDGTLRGGPVFATNTPAVAPDSRLCLRLDGVDDFVEVQEPLLPAAYTISTWVRFDTLRPCSLIVFTDSAGPTANWSHQLRLNGANQFEHYTWDGSPNLVISRTVAQTNRWYHVAATAENNGVCRLFVNGGEEGAAEPLGTLWPAGDRWLFGSNSGGTPYFLDGGLDEVAIWHEALPPTQIASLAAGTSPLSRGGLAGLFTTDLDAALWSINSTAWFRYPFTIPTGIRYDQLLLHLRYNDGYVLWLNGTPLARQNAPDSLNWDSVATAGRTPGQSALPDIIDLSGRLDLLRPGTNLLTIQGLNLTSTDQDFLIQAELTARRRPVTDEPQPLVFNEVPPGNTEPFWCELVNSGSTPVQLEQYALRGSAGTPLILSPGLLPAGQYVVVSLDPARLEVHAGDPLFLTTADSAVLADAVRLGSNAKARKSPSTAAPFLVPSSLTPGTANAFALHDEIIINEVLYHAPPTYRRRGVPPETVIKLVLPWNAVWRYHQAGVDLGTAWREPEFDDSAWPRGPGLLGYRTSALAEPIRTSLTLGQWTYYFRVPVVLERPPTPASVQLRVLVDDGAVFYWNGQEVFRQKMPAGDVSYSTPGVNVGDPVITGPHLLTVPNLVHGTNWLAVEVHQWNLASSDVVCGAELAVAEETQPGTPDTPFAQNPAQWIELFNRSDHPVPLDGWSLAGAVEFQFPPGIRLDPGGFLVVARDAATLRTLHPDIRIAGDFRGRLSHRGDDFKVLDPNGNVADELRYADDEPWPSRADGGGSTLERRDPRADSASPNAWAASLESSRASWQHYTFTSPAVEPVFGPPLNGFSELRLGLLDDGECYLDNISVVEDPAGTRRQLIQNGAFDNGASTWRCLGNHSHSRIESDPQRPGNPSLHLIATDARGYLHNQIETTLKSGGAVVPVVAGRIYEVSFDAKWVAGSPQLHTELYYNRIARTTVLSQPDRQGTPGQPNSTLTTNLGPTYSGLHHDPPVPTPEDSITFSTVVNDPDGIAQVTLHYSVNEGPWRELPMSPASSSGSADEVRGIRYSATLSPPGPSGTVVQFYVSGQDPRGASSMCPAAGPDSRALIRVDTRSAGPKRRAFHVILAGRDGRLLDDFQNMMSDDRLGATVVWDNREIFYDCGVHLHGSMFSRNNPDAATLNLKFPGDHWFRGVHRTVQAKRRVIQEIIAKHVQTQSGVPGMYEDIVQLFAHRPGNAGPARLSLAHYNDVFLDSQFDDGADGTLFNLEGIRVAMATHDGTPEGIKLPFPIDWVGNYDITDLGADPEQYRWTTMIRNNRARDDFSRYMALAQTFSRTGAALQQSVPAVMDAPEWMRVFALLSLFGIGDAYTQGNPHNLNLYVRPSDQRILAFPYDWDFFFALDPSAPLWGDGNLAKIIALPVYTRVFHGQLLDLIETTFNAEYLAPWVNHFSTVAGEDYRYALDRVRARSDYVRNHLPAPIAFAITSNNGADFAVTNASAALEGRAWIDVDRINLAGQPNPLPITWLDGTRWRVTVPLPAPTNHLTLEARNRRGELVGQDAITVTTTEADDSQRASLRITEVMYHPGAPTPAERASGVTDADRFEFVELANFGPRTVSLVGVRFDRGITFDFTTSTRTNLEAGARVLVAKDPGALQIRYGASLPIAGPYGGSLDNSGETLRLLDRFGAVIEEFAYDDSGDWPSLADGRGNSLERVDPQGDPAVPASWQASAVPGGSPGMVELVRPIVVSSHVEGDRVVMTFTARADQPYRLEDCDDLALGRWREVAVIPPGPTSQVIELRDAYLPTAAARFYRIVSP